ncbi:MAG: hypothetical protein PHR83_10285 [Paludibacter sp.]|nr:hypothetical protein [Paludibacter sp.]
MRIKFFLSFIFIFPAISYSQQYHQYPEQFRNFIFKSPTHKHAKSHYDKIKVIDLRKDSIRMGTGQFGLLNKRLTITPNPCLSDQLSRIIMESIDSTSTSGQMILCLRKLILAERTAAYTEEGFCSFTATLYSKLDSNYYFLQSIDTLIRIQELDVTKRMIFLGDSIVTNFLARNLLNKGKINEPLTLSEIIFADSIAKQKLNLYRNTKFANGLYYTYKSFSNQIPDRECVLNKKNDKINWVKITDSKGELQKIQPKSVYAVVSDGIPYIATEFGFYELKRMKGELTFLGKMYAPSLVGSIPGMYMFGFVGGAISSGFTSSSYFRCIVNYKNGEFVKLKEVPFGEEEFDESMDAI